MADTADWASGPPPKQAPSRSCRPPKSTQIALVVRCIAAVSGGFVTVASFVGFKTATNLVKEGTKQLTGNTTYRDVGLFTGVMMLFLMFAGVLIVGAEVRLPWMRRRILRPFGFVLTHWGRGLFEMFCGFALGVVSDIFARLIGGFMLGCGACAILLSFFLPKETMTVSMGLTSRAKPKDTSAIANEIKWGQDDGDSAALTGASPPAAAAAAAVERGAGAGGVSRDVARAFQSAPSSNRARPAGATAAVASEVTLDFEANPFK